MRFVGTICFGHPPCFPGLVEGYFSLGFENADSTPLLRIAELNFLRNILDFVKRIQKHFFQESQQLMKHGSTVGIMKQNGSPWSGSIVVIHSEEVLDITVR
jgi:hypothetical protein